MVVCSISLFCDYGGVNCREVGIFVLKLRYV